MKEILFESRDEDQPLEVPCPFCGSVIEEFGKYCAHVVLAENEVYFVNPALESYIDSTEADGISCIDPEEYLEEHGTLFQSLTKLTMYFLYDENDIEELKGCWVADIMKGPQDKCVYFLMSDEDLMTLCSKGC